MKLLDRIDPVDLGDRLRQARSEANITQADAANIIQVARTTLVAIEKGSRKIKADELVKLSDLYDVSCNELLQKPKVQISPIPLFRLGRQDESHQESALTAFRLLRKLSEAYLHIEQLLNCPLQTKLPQKKMPSHGKVEDRAEDLALHLRTEMGLGLHPVPDLASKLTEWGCRVFLRRIDSNVAGVCFFHETLGPCVILNLNQPQTRRNMSAGHELGHLIFHQEVPDILLFCSTEKKPIEERFSDAFSYSFAMPRAALTEDFNEIVEVDGKFSLRSLVYLSRKYHVSFEGATRRLEDLGLIPEGTFERVRNAKTPALKEEAQEELSIEEEALFSVPNRLGYLMSVAHDKELLSEGQLAKMLDLSIFQVRAIIDHFEFTGDGE